jgi:type IV secretion system protein VirB10
MAMPTPAAVPYQASRPATPDPAHEERIRHYQRAVSSDLMVKIDKGSTLETPRLLTAQQADHSPIAVNAKPAPPHTISAWTFIYGTLETGIRSDHPGDVIGRVSQDVKDTVTQTETLIPMGSRLHGIQRGAQQVQLNDTSIVVTWDDIEFPNGGHIPIPRMPGTDSEGYPGFEDLVDRHLAQTWGPAVLVSAITAGTMLATRPTYGGINGYDPMQQAAGSFGQTLGTRAVGGLNSEASQTKPTITIREGYTFRVLVTATWFSAGPTHNEHTT